MPALNTLKTKKVIVVAGPTAVGKTAFAFQLAQSLNQQGYQAFLINADALAVYQGMVIGTAAPKEEEFQGIPHFLYNVHAPSEEYNIHQFRKEVEEILLERLQNEKAVPLLVGGSHQYLSSFIENLQYCEVPTDFALRKRLEEEYRQNPVAFYEKIQKEDALFAQKVALNDAKRLIRAAELLNLTGKGPSYHQEKSKEIPSPWEIFSFFLDDDRKLLYERINQRVHKMFEEGFKEEVEKLLEIYALNEENAKPTLSKTALSAIGYAECIDVLQKKCSLEEAIEKIQLRSRHLAKRQLTWLRGKEYFQAFSVQEKEKAKQAVFDFLRSK